MRFVAFFLLISCLLPGVFAQPPGRDYLVVPHLPANNGVFQVSIILENQLNEQRSIGIYPFGINGQSYDVVTLALEPNSRQVLDPVVLFKENPVSFFYVIGHFKDDSLSQDTMTGLVVGVSLGYADNPEETAYTNAISQPSKHWRVQCGDWKDNFDGLAIVNLDVCAETTFQLKQFDAAGNLLAARTLGSQDSSFIKQVVNLSSLFEPVAGSYVDVVSSMRLAITGLRGSLNTDNGWIVGNMAINLPDDQKERRILEDNREKFRSMGFTHYSYNTHNDCYCAGNQTRDVNIQVRDNWIQSFTYVDNNTEVETYDRQSYKTVEQLFDYISDLMDNNYYRVIVDYHPEYGVPTAIRIDADACLVDEEVTHSFTDFSPLR